MGLFACFSVIQLLFKGDNVTADFVIKVTVLVYVWTFVKCFL